MAVICIPFARISELHALVRWQFKENREGSTQWVNQCIANTWSKKNDFFVLKIRIAQIGASFGGGANILFSLH